MVRRGLSPRWPWAGSSKAVMCTGRRSTACPALSELGGGRWDLAWSLQCLSQLVLDQIWSPGWAHRDRNFGGDWCNSQHHSHPFPSAF